MKKYFVLTFFYVAYTLNCFAQSNDKTFGFTFSLDSTTNQYTVIETIKGGPAEIAKLNKGNTLISINTIELKNKELDEVGLIFKNAKDASILTVLQNGKEKIVTITKTDRLKLFDKAATYKTYKLKNGDQYQGFAVNENIFHGKGKYTSQYGEIYEGNFVNTQLQGKGKIVYQSGAVYEGNCKNSFADGVGKFTYNGDVYIGEFVEGNKSGKGKITYANGNIYDGDWKENNKEGKGKFIFKNGDEYYGDWKNDIQQGNGKYTFRDGDILTGTWVNSAKEGNFDWYSKATNTTKTILYKNGEVVKNEVITGGSYYDNNGGYIAPTVNEPKDNNYNNNSNNAAKKEQDEINNKIDRLKAIDQYNKLIEDYNKSITYYNSFYSKGKAADVRIFYRSKLLKALQSCMNDLDAIERMENYYSLPKYLKDRVKTMRAENVKEYNQLSQW
jgi:hypothetical protein